MKKRKKQSGDTILIVMVLVALAAITFGFLVIRGAIKSPLPATNNQTTSSMGQTPAPTPSPAVTPTPTAALAGWKTYLNAKYNYSVMYPPNLKVGSISSNSVLGDFSNPVKGYHVGPLVFISLNSTSLRKTGADYFNGFYAAAKDPVPPTPDGMPASSCTVDKINNRNVAVKSVSCTGEGGAAKYALIIGTSFDVFVDGYSKGYDSADNGTFAKNSDYATILSTFTFSPPASPAPAPTSMNPAPAPAQTPAPGPTPAPSLQTFSITADDSGADPSQVSVPVGTIVEISFNVSSMNVYHGGLDFRSSVVNSGTVYAGQSKTISFTASKSFAFTPYWPASNIAKPYTIQVNVQ